MNELFKIILSLSLSGTILILLLLLLCPLYKNRLSKRWQYYIWLLVIVRLLLPLTPKTSIVGNLFRQAEERIEQNTPNSTHLSSADSSVSLRTERISSTELGNIDSSGTVDIDSDTDIYAPPTENAANDKLRIGMSENILFSFGILWLCIAALLFVRKITIYQSFVKYVNAGSTPVDDMNLLEHFGRILDENHVHGTIDLRVNGIVASPLLIGFAHAIIVLPTTDLSEEDFYYTVLHELTHYKRKDMFYKWLVQLTVCLHWFNPFVYLMESNINRLCELSCDERVIAPFPEHSRKSYGDTLIHAISTGGSYKDALASVTLNESKELLKGRLDAIMKYKKIPKIIQTAAIFITGVLIGGTVVLGAYAAPMQNRPPKIHHRPITARFFSPMRRPYKPMKFRRASKQPTPLFQATRYNTKTASIILWLTAQQKTPSLCLPLLPVIGCSFWCVKTTISHSVLLTTTI